MVDALASHLDAVAAMAPTWGFVLIAVFMAVESSFIPFPSEVVMIPAGFIAARGEFGFSPSLSLAAAMASGVAGSLLGAYANYFLSLKVGKPFLLKYGKWFFVKPEPLERACEIFNRYGAETTFVCRLVPVVRQLISIPAGIARMPLGSFSLFTGLGAGTWTAVLAFAGWWLGKTSKDLTYGELVRRGAGLSREHLPLVILAAVLLAFLYWGASKLVMGGKKPPEGRCS